MRYNFLAILDGRKIFSVEKLDDENKKKIRRTLSACGEKGEF